jgi:anti-sigma factor RsiW
MVSDTHPHEIELFEYVEEELPEARRAEIAAHLASCRTCAQQVALATTGRHALQSGDPLELPEHRREAILRTLPVREPELDARRAFSPRLVLVGLTALLLLAAIVGILIDSRGGGGMESAGATGAASDASRGAAELAQPKATLFAGGSAEAVAEELRRKGFTAMVQKNRVVVRGATKQQVREALADRGPGDVEVVVAKP